MNTTTSLNEFAEAEGLLASAGITATTVEQCDNRRCHWCDRATLPAAA